MNEERRRLELQITVLNTQVRPREHLRLALSSDIAAIERP
jgi:hypothetical protein